MNEPTNAPMLPPPSGVSQWISVWRDALTRPSEQTFARISQSPNAKSTTAFLWIFLGSLVSSLLALPAQGAMMRQMMQSMGLEGQGFAKTWGWDVQIGTSFMSGSLWAMPLWQSMQVCWPVKR